MNKMQSMMLQQGACFTLHPILRLIDLENQMGKISIDPIIHSTTYDTQKLQGDLHNMHEYINLSSGKIPRPRLI